LSSTLLRNILTYPLLVTLLFACGVAQQPAANPAELIIPDGTPVTLRLAENVSSSHAHQGDQLNFTVVRDVNVGGFTLIPAGTIAHGSVTAVKGKRFLGMGGNVALKLDSVELASGERVALRGGCVVKGPSRTKLMLGGMIVTSLIFLPATPVLLLTRGHDSTAVKSTEVIGRIEGATPVSTAQLQPTAKSSSELAEMMDYLPPRVFDGEGREADMLNLVFVAQPKDLQQAFARGGWVKTDTWKPVFVWHLLRRRTNDSQLPMARFYLFGRVQDYSYALPDPNAIVTRRHHLRIWKTGYTVNGTPIWAAAATHDVSIEYAKGGHLINHRIDPAVDDERDFVGANLTDASWVSGRQYLHSLDPVLQAQTASGEAFHSDGRILLLDLQPVTKVASEQAPAVPPSSSLPPTAPALSFLNVLTSIR
jgi:LssY C-terminus